MGTARNSGGLAGGEQWDQKRQKTEKISRRVQCAGTLEPRQRANKGTAERWFKSLCETDHKKKKLRTGNCGFAQAISEGAEEGGLLPKGGPKKGSRFPVTIKPTTGNEDGEELREQGER